MLQEELEQNCINRVLNGEPEAFRLLVERHEDHVLGIAIQILKGREEAEEVAQDVFLKAYRSLDKYAGKSKFGTWLYRITYNEAISKLRGNKKQRAVLADDFDEYDFVDTEVYDEEHEEQLLSLEEAVQKLKEPDQLLLNLYYQQDKKVKEIAEIIGMSESNIKIRLHRSRSTLQELLKKKGHGEQV